MEDLSRELKELLLELGVICIGKGVQKTPNYTLYHFNLVDINQFNQIEKKAKFISAYLHKDITVKKSDIGHFALAVPNEKTNIVNFYDNDFNILFGKDKTKNEIFVGVDDNGKPITINIEQMPHILVSGCTGSGKSVAINGIICSLLRNSKPNDIEFVMIDTKRVELSPYRKLKGNAYCDVSTTFQEAIESLDDVCEQIELRYKLMEEHGLRKLPNNFSRIVVVIEELGDLMAVSQKAVEKYIIKIAQLGRACGVHLVIATQRPSSKVVTGEIKANIACRLALQTTSMLESRIILDHNGAEALRGKGDAILKLPTSSTEIHLQCPMITDEQILKTIENYIGD